MDLTQLKPLVQLVALLVLAGCASASKQAGSANLSVKNPSTKLASLVGNAEQGAQVQLPADNTLGVDSIVVDRTYFAASGRECRRLRHASGAPMLRVACKGRDGEWRFARDLRTSSSAHNATQNSDALNTQSLVPSAGTTLLLNNDAIDTSVDEPIVMGAAEPITSDNNIDIDEVPLDFETSSTITSVPRELYANETLWSFAKRTTGNALNWQAIAEHNGISDAKTLAPGAVLDIPVELVGPGE